MPDQDLFAAAALALRALAAGAVSAAPGGPEAVLASPWRGPELGLSIHLFDARPFTAQDRRLPSLGRAAPPPAWTLHFLLAFFAPDELTALRLAGAVGTELVANPLMPGGTLAAAAAAGGLPSDTLGSREARLAVEPLAIADMTSLWLRFAPMRYAPSLAVSCTVL